MEWVLQIQRALVDVSPDSHPFPPLLYPPTLTLPSSQTLAATSSIVSVGGECECQTGRCREKVNENPGYLGKRV